MSWSDYLNNPIWTRSTACATGRFWSYCLVSGLRVSELVGLDRDNVNLKRKEFMVRGKGQKDRPIFISPSAAAWVEVYLMRRDTEAGNSNSPAASGRNAKPLLSGTAAPKKST